jgi:hypothetical protein
LNGSSPARSIAIVRDPSDPVAAEPPVSWAIERFQKVLLDRKLFPRVVERVEPGEQVGATVIVAGAGASSSRGILARSGVYVPRSPETLALVPGTFGERKVLLAWGADTRGLVYALLELVDRLAHGEDPLEALRIEASIVEEPANAVRSAARVFASELNDKPWFHDEGFWRRYLSMLVSQRFNRFSLTLGLGYNFPKNVTDAYLYFAYPFLVSVPGHDVRVPQLPDEERERNLEMLRFISEEAARRGLDFQLGLWTHAYEWIDSPDALHSVEGLEPERHAAYCRDAVRLLLDACPSIAGLTFRTHGESGIPERSWDFWRVVLDGAASAGRTVGIDLHAKGLDAETLRIALDTGLPVTVSPKYWAEHMGLPYHQAGIRELERPKVVGSLPPDDWHRYMTVSEGSRPFTRYGYGDFLRDDREYDVVFRIWPGTQRLLLWGDPAMAAGFGRHAGIAGSQGLEWFEPLTFKGREGSARPGSRDGYEDRSLSPADDWQKYEYTYRLFGRLTYDPDASPETWRRHLRVRLGTAATAAELALTSASRILPLVTTAYHPSASNNYFWPEIYTNMPIAATGDSTRPQPYVDTPSPRRFGTVSPLDPELFSSVEEFVREVLADERSGRYSPLDVADWLERLSAEADEHLEEMRGAMELASQSEVRRWVIDTAIQARLGRFFAQKLRAGVWYEVHRSAGSAGALRDAVVAYRAARAAWGDAAALATGAYVRDLTFGPQARLRGSWSDRLEAIDEDIADMSLESTAIASLDEEAELAVRRKIEAATARHRILDVRHTVPPPFHRGEEIHIELELRSEAGEAALVRLHHRHLDQSRRYVVIEMQPLADRYVATVPREASDSPYPLQYFFEVRDTRGHAHLYPGLDTDLSNQPYFLVSGSGSELRARSKSSA